MRTKNCSRSGLSYIVNKHGARAAKGTPRLAKKRISPHVMRHTCAVQTLEATGDIRHVALLLGHAQLRTTEVYLRADPLETLEAKEAVLPDDQRRGRFNEEVDFLEKLRQLCKAPEPLHPLQMHLQTEDSS